MLTPCAEYHRDDVSQAQEPITTIAVLGYATHLPCL